VDGKSLTERFARLTEAGVDYAYVHRLPRWGCHHGASPSSWSSGLVELHLFLVDVCVVALLTRGSFDMLHGAGGGPFGDPVGNPATSRSWKGSLGGAIAGRQLVHAASSTEV
jgi:hypothetical protein